MPIPEDDRFESYLKRFQPVVPDALPLHGHRREIWRRPLIGLIAAAAVVILAVVSFFIADRRVPANRNDSVSIEIAQPSQPLTMREANALLASSPSYKAVVENMAFRNRTVTIPNGKQSALAVLAKEKVKL